MKPGVLRFMGLQRVRHDWVTEVNWTEYEATELRVQKSVCELFMYKNYLFIYSTNN